MRQNEDLIVSSAKHKLTLKCRSASRPRMMLRRQGAENDLACSSGSAMLWQTSGRTKIRRVICSLELNSPAIVTPLMDDVSAGCVLGGSELVLKHNVCEPESHKMRSVRCRLVF